MRPRTFEIVRVLAINALVLFVLFNLAYWSFPVLQLAIGRSGNNITAHARMGHLPNYANIDWANKQFYREMDQTDLTPDRLDFKSFVGWRRKAFSGEFINVGGPYGQRRTTNNQTGGGKTAYFFGGSTMWGAAAHDAGTIPSQFAALTGIHSENFGEVAYTAHQSLMLLIQLLQDGHRPDLVVFYDGANEAIIKCRTEVMPEAHYLESRIEHLLKSTASPASFTHYFAPVRHVAGRINSILAGTAGITSAEGYNCHSGSEKAERIADNVLRDWQMAKRIVESFGAKFIGILQPVIYFSRTRRDHLDVLDDSALLEAEFRVVYPLIRRRMAEVGGFYDLVSILDVDDYFYIDFCHLSPNGNRLVAARIAEIAELLGITRPMR